MNDPHVPALVYRVKHDETVNYDKATPLEYETAIFKVSVKSCEAHFEMKEHFAGIGMSLLPIYYWLWRPEIADTHRRDRVAITSILAFIVWWDFLIGHILNNIRGFG